MKAQAKKMMFKKLADNDVFKSAPIKDRSNLDTKTNAQGITDVKIFSI